MRLALDCHVNHPSDPDRAEEVTIIVCSCNVFSDHEVRGVVEACEARLTAAQVYDGLACRPQCGTCARTIRTIIRRTAEGGDTGAR